MKTGLNAYEAIDLTGKEVFDQEKAISQIMRERFGSHDEDYFVLGENLIENKSMKSRFKVCSVEDKLGKLNQIWFLIAKG